ncbi:MAG: RluA family pseudouridine synthase [Treponema sp.]|jgi:23S rRNA pseudouridine1911/1915/1917 synthase|nr:RluA family pseudouridine synthase [Treponema sp.]
MPSFSCTVDTSVPRGLRLDRYVAECLGLLSRSQIKSRGLKAAVNGKEVKISRPIKTGDRLELSWAQAEPVNLIPEDISLEVIYEDRRVVVINKAQGMVVHPGAGNRRGTLANALLYRRLCREGFFLPPEDAFPIPHAGPPVCGAGEGAPPGLYPGGAGLRPGIVHRLDKDTSGVIIAAWDDEALAFLADQFKNRRVKKNYLAFIPGTLKEREGRIETFIARDRRDRKRFTVSAAGRIAVTRYRVLRSWSGHSLLLLRPKTGRTHQLRVHLRYLGHPVSGDPIYGRPDPLFSGSGLMLHAKSLSIILPGRDEAQTFRAPLPERFRLFIKKLNRQA